MGKKRTDQVFYTLCTIDSCYYQFNVKNVAQALEHFKNRHGVADGSEITLLCPRCGMHLQRFTVGLPLNPSHTLMPYWLHVSNTLGGCPVADGACAVTVSGIMTGPGDLK